MKRVLIVDDREVNRQYLRSVLEPSGYDVLEAAEGRAALEAVRARKPDLVVADILMPTMDGCEFVRRLRSEPSIAHTQVILLSAHYAGSEIRALARACGVFAVLTKPVEPDVVLRNVSEALERDVPPVQSDAVAEAEGEHLRLLTDTLARKARQLETINHRLDALVQLGGRVGAERDPRRLLSIFCHAAGDILSARFAMVAITEDDSNDQPSNRSQPSGLRHVVGNGIDAKQVGRLTSPSAAMKLVQTYLSAHEVILLSEMAKPPNGQTAKSPATDERIGLGVFNELAPLLICPVSTTSRCYGLLCIGGFEDAGANENAIKRLGMSMGAVLAVAYENADRYEQIERHSLALRKEVAERKRAQEQVEQANNELEQRVVERTAELEESHTQLRNAERMASMGTLCAGLGHDMGNLLLPIRARLDALRTVPMDPDGRKHIDALAQFADYLQCLTNGLRMLACAGGQSSNKNADGPSAMSGAAASAATELNGWYMQVKPLLRSALSGQMTLEASFPKQPVAVALRRDQLTQAVYNLVHNAADAMRSRGHGSIEVSAEVLDSSATPPDGGSRPTATTDGRQHKSEGPQTNVNGRFLRLVVSDNGPGMPAEVARRAAEPFFTTKQRRFSTGLGLSLVRGIVAGAGGSLAIESQPAEADGGKAGGTRIMLDLPITSETSERENAGAPGRGTRRSTTSKSPADGGELIADDLVAVIDLPDARFRSLAASVLESGGYTVGSADDSGVDFWLLNTDEANLSRVGELLSNSSVTVAVVGPMDARWEALNVVHVGESLRPSEFCSRLRGALNERGERRECQDDHHPVCG